MLLVTEMSSLLINQKTGWSKGFLGAYHVVSKICTHIFLHIEVHEDFLKAKHCNPIV